MPKPKTDPCPYCGQFAKDWLFWSEAYQRDGHARAHCMVCLLTLVPRPQEPEEPEEPEPPPTREIKSE